MMISYSRQEIIEEDILEVEKILRLDFLTQGLAVPKFEQVIASYCGAKKEQQKHVIESLKKLIGWMWKRSNACS